MAWSPEAYDFWADNPDSPGYRDRSLLIEDDAEREVIVLDDDDDDDDDPVHAQPEYDETSCKNGVLLVFPDICPNYLSELTLQHGCAPATIISAILDRQEKGENYPTQAALESRSRKRKRASERSGPGHDLENDGDDDDDECDPERVRSIKLQMATHEHKLHKDSPRYINLAKKLLGQDFPKVPQLTIRGFLLDNGNSIFEAYTAMDEKRRTWDDANPPWAEKKTLTKILNGFTRDHLPNLDLGTFEADEQAAIAEYMAAKELSAVKDNKAQAEVEEHKNFLRAQAEGQTTDCGICFEEFPLNRMVQCEGEDMHWFCRGCLRSQAESQIGMAKYELTCMSLEGCSAGFSKAQRALFLDKKLTIALDRIEQEAVLRMAGIENLETCPFCPYAAEYPPVETDKEFRCDNPRCQLVSCRLCRKETHIPKTCAEADADRGLDARHILEEAMSAALIRRCNKCQNPFVKQDGCNKIRCTKCGTLQCDVCRKTIADYSHFNDTRRGGKNGQCPLFDENEGRYEKEVSNAEAEMRKKVVEENPDVDEEALRIPMLGNTRQDEHKLQKDPIFHQQAPQPRPFLAEWDNARHEVVDRHLLRAGGPPFHFPQNGLRLQHPFNGAVPAPLPYGAAPRNPAPRSHGRLDIFRAAEDMVQKAMKHIDRPVPLRIGGAAIPNATAIPAPRPRSFENIFTKMDVLTRRRNAEIRRSIGGLGQPQNMAQANSIPAVPQQRLPQHQHHPRMEQGIAAPMQLHENFPFPPAFQDVPHHLNVPAPLTNGSLLDAQRLEPSPMDSAFDEAMIAWDAPSL